MIFQGVGVRGVWWGLGACGSGPPVPPLDPSMQQQFTKVGVNFLYILCWGFILDCSSILGSEMNRCLTNFHQSVNDHFCETKSRRQMRDIFLSYHAR